MSAPLSSSTAAIVDNTSSEKNNQGEYRAKLTVPLPTAEGAHILLQALSVDEPLPGTTRRFYQLPEARHILCVKIHSANPRTLRMALHSVQEQIDLACRTLEAFAHTAASGDVAPGTDKKYAGHHNKPMLMPSPTLKPTGNRGLPPPVSGLTL